MKKKEITKPNMSEEKQKWYKAYEAAKEFGISVTTVRNAIRDGKLTTTKVSGKSPTGFIDLIPETALVEFMKNYTARKTVVNEVSSLTIDDIAEDILKRIQDAYDKGFKDGCAKTKNEFLAAVKGVKV